jgi:hypothetical protein
MIRLRSLSLRKIRRVSAGPSFSRGKVDECTAVDGGKVDECTGPKKTRPPIPILEKKAKKKLFAQKVNT